MTTMNEVFEVVKDNKEYVCMGFLMACRRLQNFMELKPLLQFQKCADVRETGNVNNMIVFYKIILKMRSCSCLHGWSVL